MGEGDGPGGRAIEAGDAVEHRRLAGAIGADDGGDVALAGLEGQVVHSFQPAEAHGQAGDLQHQARPCSTSSGAISLTRVRATLGVRPETSPRGRRTIMTTRARPKISMR